MPTSHFFLKRMKTILILLLCLSSASALTLPLGDIAKRVRTHHPALKAARLAKRRVIVPSKSAAAGKAKK